MQKQASVPGLILRLSPEETERFGVRCARAENVAVTQFDELMANCRQERVALLIYRCDVRSTAMAQRAEQEGFQLMDTLVHTGLDLAQLGSIPAPSGLRTSMAGNPEFAAIGDLARASFADYVGHYHADPRLPKASAAEAYGDWAERLCQSSHADEPCFVAHDMSGLAGFAALRLAAAGEVNCALCAVAPRAQGQGVFAALIAAAAGWARECGHARLTYGTQIRNAQAIRAVSGMGFRYERASYTFHKWFEPEAG